MFIELDRFDRFIEFDRWRYRAVLLGFVQTDASAGIDLDIHADIDVPIRVRIVMDIDRYPHGSNRC